MNWSISSEAAMLGLISPAIGSGIAAIADRVPAGRPIFWARSRCDSCGTTIAVRDLVPIVSFLLVKGQCRTCGKKIPQKLIVAEGTAIIASVATIVVLAPEHQVVGLLLTWVLLALAWFDLHQWRLPDSLTLLLAISGIALVALQDNGSVVDRLIGACAGYTIFAAVAMSYQSLCGRVGLGGGDVKLFGAAGAWVGWQYLPHVVLLASLLALVCILFARRIAPINVIPFGPFIAIAIWSVWSLAVV